MQTTIMTLREKIEKSKREDRINFDSITCLNSADPLVKVADGRRILVDPIWNQAKDAEGKLYKKYIVEHPRYDGIYVRQTILGRLEKAVGLLDAKYTLIVRAGHRPVKVQQQILDDLKGEFIAIHPDASGDQALEHARRYVSDPSIKLPPHCCGAAVDVDLFDQARNQLVDFGSPVNEDSEISALHSTLVNEEQRSNRLMLLKVMLQAGFASYYAEWWHYSYGDQIWAWFYNSQQCLYGLIEV